MRSIFSCLLLLFCQLITAQNRYSYNLELDYENKLILGTCHFTVTNPTTQALDTLFLHLPSKALSWRSSFFHKQFLEFQKTSLYFAGEDAGDIEIRDIRLGDAKETIQAACSACEFVPIPLADPLKSGDSVLLSFSFKMRLPAKDWLGTYYSDREWVIKDWLPEMPAMDRDGVYLYPETFERDRYSLDHNYELKITLPDSLTIASNASLTTETEILALRQQSEKAFAYRSSKGEMKTLHFQHYGTGLHLIISHDFFLFPMGNGGTLFMQAEDPFLPSILDTVHNRISKFLRNEIGLNLAEEYNLVILDRYKERNQSDNLLSIKHPGSSFELSRKLAGARFEAAIRYRNKTNGFEDVWLARGIPYYLKYRFVRSEFPDEFWTPWQDMFTEEFWQPFAHQVSGWILSLNKFDYAYQNQYLYLFLARQGLDQAMTTPADSLTRLNYGAIPQAKTYLALNHLREFVGNASFARGLNKLLDGNQEISTQSLNQSVSYFCNRDISWFFDDWISSSEIYDYKLKKFDYCPTVSTASVKNKGRLKLPYAITGYKNGEAVITEWFSGHEAKKNNQIYHEDFDLLKLNSHGQNAEWNLKDNYYRKGLFPHLKPIKIQFYQTFEDPNATQIFWVPGLGYNAYDKFLLRLDLYNFGLVTRKWEWHVAPSLSTGQGQLTGSGSIEHNIIPNSSRIFHRISAGIYTRYYHYDQDLAFFRLSPSVSFRFRKPYPKSTILQRLRLRAVHVDRELPPEFEGVANNISNASYTVINLTHRFEETRLIKPYTIKTDLLFGNQFSRVDVNADFRWMLPNRRWLILRGFGGMFLSNEFSSLGDEQNYYSLGLSGTQDFMFDYAFIGRSDETGIWSKQFFVTDGGFKTETDLYGNQWMLATNLSIPVWQVFGVFGDMALVDGFETVHYDYGIRLAFLTDFFEVYFPLGYNNSFFPNEANYASNIRYVLNIDLDAILHRVRRGYY